MKIKTSELSGVALDWAVAKLEGHYLFADADGKWRCEIGDSGPRDIGEQGKYGYSPSTDWSQGGPLIERFRVGFGFFGDEWLATEGEHDHGCGIGMDGKTHLIAACRAIVAAKLGDEVDVPEGLV